MIVNFITFRNLRQKLFSLNGSSVYISRGFALGSFIGMMPIPGFQVFVAFSLATILGVNRKAACIAVFNTNILTGVFIFGFNYWLGSIILGFQPNFIFPDNISFQFLNTIIKAGNEVILCMLVGGTLTGAVFAFAMHKFVEYWFDKKERIQVVGSGINTFTVISGASQGLGKAFAEECAKKGRNLLLLALPNEDIANYSDYLHNKYNIEVHFHEANLTLDKELKTTISFLEEFEIDVLINNAGVGGTEKFESLSIQYIDTIISLNMRTMVILTRNLLPILKKQRESYILNISSLAAFSPMPYKTIYPASKSFVYSFSRGLSHELRNTNIHVSVAHPGGMPTKKEVQERIKSHSWLVKQSILSTEETARICLKKLFEKKPLIVPGKLNKLSSILQKFLPVQLQLKLMGNKLQRELKATKGY